jgi:hypothetical protein
LALECTDEPFENAAGAILWCFALRYRGEELWTLAPVRCRTNQGDIVRARCFQIDCGAPGNSVRETGERMKGGAVSEERSPEKFAMLRSE